MQTMVTRVKFTNLAFVNGGKNGPRPVLGGSALSQAVSVFCGLHPTAPPRVIGGYPTAGWMVYFMENPMKIRMI